MKEKQKNRCLEILELSPDASWPEVTRSYKALKKLYSGPSIAIVPVEDEFVEPQRQEIVQQIEDAYIELEKIFASTRKNREKNIKAIVSEIEVFNGAGLKMTRERFQVELSDIAMATKIQLDHLQGMENEDYAALPREIYIMGYLKKYAKHLSLEPKKVVADYMAGYMVWKNGAQFL